MPRAFRNSLSWPGFMLFCFSICAIALLISASVAVTFCCLASCSSSFSSISERSTWGRDAAGALPACRECWTRSSPCRIRDTRSKTEMTSSLTTAAIRISGTCPAGGWPGAVGCRRGGRGWCGRASCADVGCTANPGQQRRRARTRRSTAIDSQPVLPRRTGLTYTLAAPLSPSRSRLPPLPLRQLPAKRQHGAADLAEVFEYDAEA